MATTVEEPLAQLEALADEKVRAHNSKDGAGDNQFGVKLGDIRKPRGFQNQGFWRDPLTTATRFRRERPDEYVEGFPPALPNGWRATEETYVSLAPEGDLRPEGNE